jgi:hypothetical protein
VGFPGDVGDRALGARFVGGEHNTDDLARRKGLTAIGTAIVFDTVKELEQAHAEATAQFLREAFEIELKE